MRINSGYWAVVGVAAWAVSVMAAPAPAPTTKPATAAASAPAAVAAGVPATASAQDAAAKGGLSAFFHAMFAGDREGAFALLAYTDSKQPKAKEAAEAMFGEILAEQRLRKAVAAEFGDKANDFGVGMGASDVADFEKELAAATVKMNGESANISMGAGPTYMVVLQGGKWLVDFDKTQANMGPLPEGADLTGLQKKAAGYEQLAKDVAAKKFGTVEDVSKAVDKVDSEADKPAGTVPATGSGPGTR